MQSADVGQNSCPMMCLVDHCGALLRLASTVEPASLVEGSKDARRPSGKDLRYLGAIPAFSTVSCTVVESRSDQTTTVTCNYRVCILYGLSEVCCARQCNTNDAKLDVHVNKCMRPRVIDSDTMQSYLAFSTAHARRLGHNRGSICLYVVPSRLERNGVHGVTS